MQEMMFSDPQRWRWLALRMRFIVKEEMMTLMISNNKVEWIEVGFGFSELSVKSVCTVIKEVPGCQSPLQLQPIKLSRIILVFGAKSTKSGCYEWSDRLKNGNRTEDWKLLSWCFELSQQQCTTSGLNTNFSLSSSYLFHKSLHHKSFLMKPQLKFYPQFRNAKPEKQWHMFWNLFIFREHSTREPASSGVTYFILLAYTGIGASQS